MSTAAHVQVVRVHVLPGIAHREPGIGQIGAGIARAPLACFAAVLRATGARIGLN